MSATTATLREGQVILKGRIGYPKLWEAEAVKNDPSAKPRFGCQVYLPKSDEATFAKVQKAVSKLIKEKLDGVKPKPKDMCIKDGDGEDGDENTKGFWIISANRQEKQGRPTVIDRNRAPLTAGDGKPYAGCWCNVLVSFYVPKGWKKITASLEIVQFWADDEPYGAPRPSVDVMPDMGDDEDADDLGI
jgi:hypothetical protein